MIFEHFVSGGWIGFRAEYLERLKRKVPVLWLGIRDKDKMRKTGLYLIHKNTEILPDLYKAIGHYLGHRKDTSNNEQLCAYFQHEQETSTGNAQIF